MKTRSPELNGTRMLVLGYGREGKSVERWLRSHYPDLSVSVADRSQGDGYLSQLPAYDTVIRSPGVPPYLEELVAYGKRGGHVTSATNVFFSLVPGTVIGVTGTKGKSTTASLIAHILRAARTDVRLVGNIGEPMLDHLDGATDETVFVAELSSHQLADTRYSPGIAVFLPVAPEHQDYYPDVATYIAAKVNIARFQKKTDTLIYDASDTTLAALLSDMPAQKALYSTDPDGEGVAEFAAEMLRVHGKDVVSRKDIKLYGNTHTILAAAVAADVVGVSRKDIGSAMQTFVPLPHRLESVGEYDGVQYVNDSLSTIPEAAVHALHALGPTVTTLIAGGYDRGLSYDVLGKAIVKSHVRTLILFPDTGARIRQAVMAAAPDTTISIHEVTTMDDAVRLARDHTPEGTICLLSPASASFNLFRDYADRGIRFAEAVRKFSGV